MQRYLEWNGIYLCTKKCIAWKLVHMKCSAVNNTNVHLHNLFLVCQRGILDLHNEKFIARSSSPEVGTKTLQNEICSWWANETVILFTISPVIDHRYGLSTVRLRAPVPDTLLVVFGWSLKRSLAYKHALFIIIN